MEGEVAGDTQSDSTVILVSADALEKKHPIAWTPNASALFTDTVVIPFYISCL